MPDQIRLLLIDEHVLVREGLARLLSAQPGFKVVGQAGTINEGLRVIRQTRVDIVLLDINLGSAPRVSFLPLVRPAGFQGKVLVVTAGVSASEAARLFQEGCSGIFLKQESPARLVERIRAIVAQPEGEPVPTGKALDAFAGNQALHPALTERECQVLRAVFAGRSNKEIAFELGVSEPLVKMVMHQLFVKTGVRSRAQLVRVALERFWRELEAENSEGTTAS